VSRLRSLRPEELTAEGRDLWDEITGGRRGSAADLTDARGGLVGPFNAMMHAPGLGRRVSELGEAVRFDASIDRRLLELAIVTVGAHWRSNFEFLLHGELALAAGVPVHVLDALARGDAPAFETEAEAVVHRFAAELLGGGRVDASTYGAAVETLGETGVVELVSLVGYYTLVALLLNAFEVPPPAGSQPLWPV
jgi:4-carboxymuconolactone decarboxylase